MLNMKKVILSMMLALGSPIAAWCADGDKFTAETVEGVQLSYIVISEEAKTAKVGALSSFGEATQAISLNVQTAVTIPEKANGYTVVEIAVNAFFGCSLGIVNIPKTVKVIGAKSFLNCSKLFEVNLPETSELESIGEEAFCSCSSLTEVKLPNRVKTIGAAAFEYCPLTSIEFGESLESIGIRAFSSMWSTFTEITLPKTLTTIGDWAFNDCSKLERVVIKGGITSFGKKVFDGATNLKSVSFGEGTTKIGVCAFYGCQKLESVTLPSTVKEICESAFDDCRALTSIDLPDGLTTIGNEAFEN